MNHFQVNKLPSIYLITDRKISNPDLLHVLEAALKAGVQMIQLREKDLSPGELKSLSIKVLKLTRFYGAKLLLNGSIELAAEIGADGIQLGVDSCSVASARKILGPEALIGYSAHSSHEVDDAASQGADFVTFSPIYFTASKAQYGPPQGLQALRDTCRNASIPVYALGGIRADRITEVLNAGASGIALISTIMGATAPIKTVHELQQKISLFHP